MLVNAAATPHRSAPRALAIGVLAAGIRIVMAAMTAIAAVIAAVTVLEPRQAAAVHVVRTGGIAPSDLLQLLPRASALLPLAPLLAAQLRVS